MYDVVRRGCDVAGDLRPHRVRCRSRAGRHRSWWRGEWPSDVAMSCDVRGGRERRGGVASDIAGAASDVAQVARARERLSDIARASSDIARDIPRGGWRGGHKEIDVFFVSSPPPVGVPDSGGDLATSFRRSAKSLGRSDLGNDVATSLGPRATSLSDVGGRCYDVVRCGAAVPATCSPA